jgi:phosphoglycerol transferase MdoB-like AlkP superfamily enzyme
LIGVLTSNAYLSPIGNAVVVAKEFMGADATKNKIDAIEITEVVDDYYRENVIDAYPTPEALSDKPNVLVLWMEGMSKEIIEGAKTDLAPNLQSFAKETIEIDNYYNHTAATYRGLRGQMISGYQYPDGDDAQYSFDSPVVSIQDVFKENGYSTTFVNSEPGHVKFTGYLNDLGYDEVIPVREPKSKDLTDRESFELLKQTIIGKETSGIPYFIGEYNIDTHYGRNSDDVVYGDGSNAVLNKFHNYDAQVGEFLKWFMNSTYSDNTLLVLTTDHASYAAPEYREAVESTQKEQFVSEIPLYFWYKGVTPTTIDVNGRNSLDLTPSILDFLGYEDTPNYFLGNSLFQSEEISAFEYVNAIGNLYYSTESCNPEQIKLQKDDPLRESIEIYYAF